MDGSHHVHGGEEGREGEVEMEEDGIYRATRVTWFSVSRGGDLVQCPKMYCPVD